VKYSWVNGTRQEATPQQKGLCCCCGNPTVSKCGTKKVWHWAHQSLKNCDAWWENETSWHRLWKNYFPEENQEIIHFDEKTGEKHIADIKNDKGMVIEIQNSPISEVELHARESFYNHMIWVINGERFKRNFIVLDKLPNPNNTFFEDIVFFRKRASATFKGVLFYRKSENLDYEEWLNSGCSGSYRSLIQIGNYNSGLDRHNFLQKIEENYIGHHLFEWKQPRTIWFSTTKPVYIDFGDDLVWLMEKYYKDRDLWCVQKFKKETLISKLGGCFPFYPPF
jgi:hypothetical protein